MLNYRVHNLHNLLKSRTEPSKIEMHTTAHIERHINHISLEPKICCYKSNGTVIHWHHKQEVLVTPRRFVINKL